MEPVAGPDFFANPQAMPRPHVAFESRVKERQVPLNDGSGGHTISVEDVVWVRVTSKGSRDTLEKVASEWILGLEQQAAAGRIPPQWPSEYRAALEAFKKGEALPIDGTALKNWPALTKSQLRVCIDAGLVTVEDLAQANEEALSRVGMGAHGLRDMAKAYLADKAGPGALAAAVKHLTVQVATMQEEMARKDEEIRALQAQVPGAAKTSPPAAPATPIGLKVS